MWKAGEDVEVCVSNGLCTEVRLWRDPDSLLYGPAMGRRPHEYPFLELRDRVSCCRLPLSKQRESTRETWRVTWCRGCVEKFM